MWKAPDLKLRLRQKDILETIANSRTAQSDHRQRARLMLLFHQGISNRKAGQQVGLNNRQAGRWRKRWLVNHNRLMAVELAENIGPDSLEKSIMEVLSDLPRSGTKPKFTAEQIATILAVACEEPQKSGLPLSHWTLPALQREVVKRGVVESISTSRLQVFLKSGCLEASSG